MALTEVILVDERDRAVGTMEKLQAQREGALHHAVTVYLFNPDGQLLLQQRAGEIPLRRSLEQHLLRPPHAGGRERRRRPPPSV